MEQINELETLLLDSLTQLSKESEEREQHISAEYAACMKSFNEQASCLKEQYERVLQQLNVSTAHYEEVMRQLRSLNALLANSEIRPKR
jgi:hypothetical protein